MPQSAELAGGEGFTFEGNAAAYYLAALLAEGFAPGVEDRTVIGVAVQQRDFGEPLDDVVVDFRSATGELARLSLQVKRSLTISDAASNTDFREIIRDCWLTLAKPDFHHGVDRYGAAVGTVTPAKLRALTTLCDLARESLTPEHFDARFAASGNAGPGTRIVRDDIIAILDELNGGPCAGAQVHQFLAHLVLIQFDFLHAGAADPPDAINGIRDCLAASDAANAPLVWSRLVELARASAGKSGQFDRARLVRSISQVARLRAASSLRSDLEKLTELAKSYVQGIQDDVGETRLERTSLTAALEAKLPMARILQIRGLPGSGKSVLLRQSVQRAIECGPVLFLKGDQLEGRSWMSFASTNGLSGSNLQELLVEIGAAGTPVFYVDAIDRIEKKHQPVVLDVLRAIIGSPLLDNWRVVVSLRDTGIEPLRNWMGELLEAAGVATIEVDVLDDDEAEILAKDKPHLRSLLFGPAAVREIVRRPFFAKVLNQGFAGGGGPLFTPQSEVDLIENWWSRGGYNAHGQNAIERQRAIVELAGVRARHLSQPLAVRQLTPASVALIDQFVTDGILQHVRRGHTVRFSHDIFFEWAFFHVLADRRDDWLEEVRAAGEPPAVARVVELLSQWEYGQGQDWARHLGRAAAAGMRSQWTRAWLLGPVGAANFVVDEDQFAQAAFADDFTFLRKALVWFQAEKTTPNPNVLAGSLPQDQKLRYADLLGWPSDFAAWRRLIAFLLRRISQIPRRLYPDVLAVFEVWQNALADIQNGLSHQLLGQCAEWLREIDADSAVRRPWDDKTSPWEGVPGPGGFRKSLGQVILRASRSEPSFAEDYLKRVIASDDIRDDKYGEIIAYSVTLAQSHPQLLVDLTLAHLKDELPEDQVAREEAEAKAQSERRKRALAKPEAERTREDELVLSGTLSIFGVDEFSHHDWESLSIDRDTSNFWPPSPLREPFHSLFQASPTEALRLLRELCNYAMTSWRQLHRYPSGFDRESPGTPVPLELTFPWGTQTFWGGDREYLWCRTLWAPKPLACGFMALDEWCFAELERGRPLDDLIQQIVEGNECIAILGVAAMLALHTEPFSEAVFPLATSQRLLHADHNRMIQDYSANFGNLMGFDGRSDEDHIKAIEASNAREVRRKQLSWLIGRYFILGGKEVSDRTRKAILAFKKDLPFQYEEHRNLPAARKHLREQAAEYAELVDFKNYRRYKTDDPDQVAIAHVSPSASKPERIAQAEQASLNLQESHVWTWASKGFETGALSETLTVPAAIALAQKVDTEALFDAATDDHDFGTRRGAVAAAAAVTLRFRDGCSDADLNWARSVLKRAIRTPEKRDVMWSSHSVIPWHQAIFVARGLAADLRAGTAEEDAAPALLGLVAHPLEAVSFAALEEASRLWPENPKLAWAALMLAFSLCHIRPRRGPRGPSEPTHSPDEIRGPLAAAEEFHRSGEGWPPLPVPPPAWVKVDASKARGRRSYHEDYDDDDNAHPGEVWGEPDTFWYPQYAAKILPLIPVEGVLASAARAPFLDFLAGVLTWTNQKNAPPWVKPGRRDRSASQLFEWTRRLGETLGRLAGFLPLADMRPRFLDPILALEGDNCWALLASFSSTYVCAYIYDAQRVPDDAGELLDLCLGRLLAAPELKPTAYRAGEFSGHDQPRLARTLMFVSVERADMAARYVNGDWSEIDRILPLVDRFVRAGGWASSVMGSFLTLCERAKASYPAEPFADQILSVLADPIVELKGWRGTFLAARIAGLVQHFADRDTPMPLGLAQKFLRILDLLVDMGDRRSAALQLGEAFREVRIASSDVPVTAERGGAPG